MFTHKVVGGWTCAARVALAVSHDLLFAVALVACTPRNMFFPSFTGCPNNLIRSAESNATSAVR